MGALISSVLSNGAELGPVRKCWFALWARSGGFARPDVPDTCALIPVFDRPLRCWKDVAAAHAVFVTAADAGSRESFWTGCLAARQECARGVAFTHRYRAAGLP